MLAAVAASASVETVSGCLEGALQICLQTLEVGMLAASGFTSCRASQQWHCAGLSRPGAQPCAAAAWDEAARSGLPGTQKARSSSRHCWQASQIPCCRAHPTSSARRSTCCSCSCSYAF